MVLKSVHTTFRRALPDNHPWAVVRHLLFGHPLKTSSQGKETLGFFLGLPILAIDALSSVAYATEEILIALSVAGTSLYGFSLPIAIAIVILLASVVASYVQTVQAYPDGGGAYIIAKNHLGSIASLVAASSLLIDYILTVSVSVTAGVRAIASSYPSLLNNSVSLSVSGILFLAWINLRGIRESARFVSPFVYTFIACMLAAGVWGVLFSFPQESSASAMNGLVGFSSAPASTSLTTHLLDLATIPIILRAFAGGCTAMTGIEAVANAGSILSKPHAVVAQRILLALGLLLGSMFLTITITAYRLGLTPLENESLLSQLIRTLWGGGAIHDSIQILVAVILFLAANTAFADAPRLSAMLARDGWLPRQLYIIGDRLVFSKGIILLAVAASILVILFQGKVHALIPLYAIGVFSAFTLSQTGMVIYWRDRRKSANAHAHTSACASSPVFQDAGRPMNDENRATSIQDLGGTKPERQRSNILKNRNSGNKLFIIKGTINGFGALMTALALIITFEAKFMEGAFLILMVVPVMVMVCLWIKRHYTLTAEQLNVDEKFIASRVREFATNQARPVIVPISRLHRGAIEAIAFAREMSKDVRIVIVDIDRYNAQKTIADVEALHWDLEIVVLPSPYRSVIRPIVDYVHSVDKECKRLSVLVLPETVPVHWWENVLHNKTSENIIKALSWSEHIGNQARIIINIPYYLE